MPSPSLLISSSCYFPPISSSTAFKIYFVYPLNLYSETRLGTYKQSPSLLFVVMRVWCCHRDGDPVPLAWGVGGAEVTGPGDSCRMWLSGFPLHLLALINRMLWSKTGVHPSAITRGTTYLIIVIFFMSQDIWGWRLKSSSRLQAKFLQLLQLKGLLLYFPSHKSTVSLFLHVRFVPFLHVSQITVF